MPRRLVTILMAALIAAALYAVPIETRARAAARQSGYLLVPDYDRHNVLRFDAHTGAFVDEFVTRHSGGLNQSYIALYGPRDHNLYVSCGHFDGPGQLKAVLRFDGATGAFMDEFVNHTNFDMPHQVLFGPDGNLYIGDRIDVGAWNKSPGARIARFDGTTGAYIDDFVPVASGGLQHPLAYVFGPNGVGGLDLYVADEDTQSIHRYDGSTGAYKGEFVAPSANGLRSPFGLTFGPDGNLYVCDFHATILRFHGPSAPAPGTPMPSPGNGGAVFIAAGSGGVLSPIGCVFGPDGNRDGQQDLYVSSIRFNGYQHGKQGTVKRFDGVTGAFIDTFVRNGVGGMDDPNLITFSETDPVTLAYNGR